MWKMDTVFTVSERPANGGAIDTRTYVWPYGVVM